MIKTVNEVRKAMENHWGKAAIFTFWYFVIVFGVSAILSKLGLPSYAVCLLYLLLLPLIWSYSTAFLANARGGEGSFNVLRMFDGYQDFIRIFTTTLLMQVYTFLWTLLLIVPGIIKGLSYSMTYYILRDNPEMKNNEAIELSMKMMDGYKLPLFSLYLSFFGWYFICSYPLIIGCSLFFTHMLTAGYSSWEVLYLLPLGIGYLWLVPYMQASMAQFYEEVKADYELKRER